MMKNAVHQARSGEYVEPETKRMKTGGTLENHEVRESHEVKAFVIWLLHHVTDSGAELMPFAFFDGLETVDEVLQKAASITDLADADKLCKVRLHEHKFREVYDAYVAYGQGPHGDHFRFEILDIETTRKLFDKHPRLKHIYMARNTDQFAKCDSCFKLRAEVGSSDRDRRARAQRLLSEHYATENANRQDYVRRTMEPKVDEISHVVTGSISIILDKPTKEATKLPAAAQLPKQISARLQNTVMGAIAHGISVFAFPLPPATSDGVNATIECLYAVIAEIQKKYATPRRLCIQADNHGDNKCATMLLFLAWLIGTGIIDEAELSFLAPGHGHTDLDQLFSNWLRRILDRGLRCVTHSRLMEAIKTASRRRHAAQAEVVSIAGVRDWKTFFSGAAADVDLRRLAMSNVSGEAVYQFILKRGENGTVNLTYKERSTNSDIYPRPFHDGEVVRDDVFGSGSYIDVAFSAEAAQWRGVVEWENGQRTVRHAPPSPIVLFGGGSGLPSGSPMENTVL